jgi:hypothetical protein
MKKVTQNKIDELCYRVYITKDFQKELSELRSKYGIPENGLKSEKAYERWYKENTDNKNRMFSERCGLIADKHGLPPAGKFRIKEYILFGTSGIRPESLDVWMPLDEMGTCEIELSNKKDERWSAGNPFVKIVISDHASQNDAVSYVRSHWSIIQKLLDARRNGQKKRLVRSVHNRDLQEEILRLSRYSTKELRMLAKKTDAEGKFRYKETAIKELIKARYGITLSDSSIKKIINRRSKLKRH